MRKSAATSFRSFAQRSPASGPRTSSAVDSMSATAGSSATTVTLPQAGTGSPCGGRAHDPAVARGRPPIAPTESWSRRSGRSGAAAGPPRHAGRDAPRGRSSPCRPRSRGRGLSPEVEESGGDARVSQRARGLTERDPFPEPTGVEPGGRIAAETGRPTVAQREAPQPRRRACGRQRRARREPALAAKIPCIHQRADRRIERAAGLPRPARGFLEERVQVGREGDRDAGRA